MDEQNSKRLSWRDPDGFVAEVDDRIVRAIAPGKAAQIRELMNSSWMIALVEQGIVPSAVEVDNPFVDDAQSAGWMWLEHGRLFFPCYPHEITALQLYDSAQLTLDVALEAAAHGWMLKDASAWNVLHSAGRGVFVDLLSFDRLPATGMWRAYGQFVRHFVLPLMLHRKLGLSPAELFLLHRDGMTPERVYQLLGKLRLLSPSALEHVVLPKLLARAGGRLIAAETEKGPHTVDSEIAVALPVNTLQRLRGTTRRLMPDEANSASTWKLYEEERIHYSEADVAAKTAFVKTHLGLCRTVLDLGCNAGEFSMLAADTGASVLATDSDHAALSRLYGRVRKTDSRITPLLLNIARPTPAVGWLNAEIPSFLERCAGKFECVLALGLMHHLLVSERASVVMITTLLERIGPERIILEWVDPMDPKFRQLAGFDIGLYQHLDGKAMEDELAKKFRLDAKLSLPCKTRVMYSWGLTNPSH